MFRDRSRIRKVVIVEDGAAMLPKTLVEIRRDPRDLDDRPSTLHPYIKVWIRHWRWRFVSPMRLPNTREKRPLLAGNKGTRSIKKNNSLLASSSDWRAALWKERERFAFAREPLTTNEEGTRTEIYWLRRESPLLPLRSLLFWQIAGWSLNNFVVLILPSSNELWKIEKLIL